MNETHTEATVAHCFEEHSSIRETYWELRAFHGTNKRPSKQLIRKNDGIVSTILLL